MLCVHYSLATKCEYHYIGRELYERLLHTVYYTLFNTLPQFSYTLDTNNVLFVSFVFSLCMQEM